MRWGHNSNDGLSYPVHHSNRYSCVCFTFIALFIQMVTPYYLIHTALYISVEWIYQKPPASLMGTFCVLLATSTYMSLYCTPFTLSTIKTYWYKQSNHEKRFWVIKIMLSHNKKGIMEKHCEIENMKTKLLVCQVWVGTKTGWHQVGEGYNAMVIS